MLAIRLTAALVLDELPAAGGGGGGGGGGGAAPVALIVPCRASPGLTGVTTMAPPLLGTIDSAASLCFDVSAAVSALGGFWPGGGGGEVDFAGWIDDELAAAVGDGATGNVEGCMAGADPRGIRRPPRIGGEMLDGVKPEEGVEPDLGEGVLGIRGGGIDDEDEEEEEEEEEKEEFEAAAAVVDASVAAACGGGPFAVAGGCGGGMRLSW